MQVTEDAEAAVMQPMLSIRSSDGTYPVEAAETLSDAIAATWSENMLCLADANVVSLYGDAFAAVPANRLYVIEAAESEKSYEALTPLFTWLLEHGIKRDGTLLVVGGGVLQDIGCFIASVLFRGIGWTLVPTTLLAQADSCIGSKSSINIGPYKNQIGTFYPPRRVVVADSVLGTLTWDDVRSGIGEIIKLHLLAGKDEYQRMLHCLPRSSNDLAAFADPVLSALRIKQRFIEEDEFDTGVRNLLNYGHTFAHAYESATHYAIPHGIAVTLGMLSATMLSARLGLVTYSDFAALEHDLRPWYSPFHERLREMDLSAMAAAIRLDKKATAKGVNCIVTRGPGKMEKRTVSLEADLIPAVEMLVTYCAAQGQATLGALHQ